MTEPRFIQNFLGYHATIATEQRAAVVQLEDMLSKLGISSGFANIVDGGLHIDIATMHGDKDVLFVDSDLNVAAEPDGLEISRTIPVIGIIGSEAPSRLKPLMQLGVTATLRKPVHRSSIYSALFVGINEFRRRRYLIDRMDEQDRRRLRRRSIVKAVLKVMADTGCDDTLAYDQLRRESMRVRQSMEDFCETFIRNNGPEQDEPQITNGDQKTTSIPYNRRR